MYMKTQRFTYRLLSLTFVFATMSVYAQKDIVTIYRPTSGLNDSTDQGGLQGGKETFANEFSRSTNYAAGIHLYSEPTSNCNYTKVNGYIQFDVTTLPKEVDSIFVGFTHYPHTDYCYSHCAADYYFSVVTEPWYEQELTYNKQPAFETATFYGPIPIRFPNNLGLREYNITETYKLWRNGTVPNYGFVIHSPSVGCNNASARFLVYSSDDEVETNRPYLKIYYKDNSSSINENDLPEDKVFVYTNPTNNQIVISGLLLKSSIRIFNSEGKELYSQTTDQSVLSVPSNKFSKGIYIIMISNSVYSTAKKLILN